MREKISLLFFLLLSTSCTQLEKLKHETISSPDEWCVHQPCYQIGQITISQPTSSIIVYLLALLSIFVGYFFMTRHQQQVSRKWWGISLLLGGIGALLAGTSYQAFGYEIKCDGRPHCIWTSWWEIGYEILTVASAGALLIGVAYTCFSKKWQQLAQTIALLISVIYLATILVGLILPNRFLLSFEWMILFVTPSYCFILISNAFQYFRNKKQLLRQLMVSWFILFLTVGIYYGYMMANMTQFLWQKGIWFSDNDVLHLGMMAWIGYIYFVLRHNIKDRYLRTI